MCIIHENDVQGAVSPQCAPATPDVCVCTFCVLQTPGELKAREVRIRLLLLCERMPGLPYPSMHRVHRQ
jgi:hypothetical protein